MTDHTDTDPTPTDDLPDFPPLTPAELRWAARHPYQEDPDARFDDNGIMYPRGSNHQGRTRAEMEAD